MKTLDVLRKQRASYEPVKRAAKKGDRVNVAFRAEIDGQGDHAGNDARNGNAYGDADGSNGAHGHAGEVGEGLGIALEPELLEPGGEIHHLLGHPHAAVGAGRGGREGEGEGEDGEVREESLQGWPPEGEEAP